MRNARGRTGTHHVTYEFALADGRVLRARISHPVNRSEYGRSLWAHVLRDQLQVTEAQFWACVNDGVRPDRGLPAPPAASLPAELARLLITKVGLTEAEVAAMTRDEAVRRIQRYWTEGR